MFLSCLTFRFSAVFKLNVEMPQRRIDSQRDASALHPAGQTSSDPAMKLRVSAITSATSQVGGRDQLQRCRRSSGRRHHPRIRRTRRRRPAVAHPVQHVGVLQSSLNTLISYQSNRNYSTIRRKQQAEGQISSQL